MDSFKVTGTVCDSGSHNGGKRPSDDKFTEEDQEFACKVARLDAPSVVSNSRMITPEKVVGAGDASAPASESAQGSHSESDDEMEQDKKGVQELATKTLNVQSKRYYIDVKQNRRGKFIKIAEVGASGGKNRLTLAMSAAAALRDHMTDFSEHYAQLGPPNPDNPPEDGRLKSEVIINENKRYYLDLKENARGRFLKVSQTVNRARRTQIALPAQGLVEFKNALTELLDEFGTENGTADVQPELPENRFIRVENKNFYFDIGNNYRGIFMRVSEVQPRNQYRTSITIPERSWGRFRDVFSDYVDKMKELRAAPVEEEEEDQDHEQGDGEGEGDGDGDGDGDEE